MSLLAPATLMRQRLLTLALAGLGVAVFWLLNLPLPFLFGPLSASLLAALLGARLRGFGQISVAARTILGVAVGASITPALVGQLPQMAASVALIPIYVAVIALVGVPFFHRVCGFDKATAWYAAMPGGLQDMVIFGTEAGGDPRALSLIHATRVLIVVSIAPAILTLGMAAELTNPIGQPAADLPLHEMALMVVAALVGWKGGERIGLFGASILGPMIVTAILSLLGLIHARPPAEGILFAQFMIGIGIGVGYVGITLAEFRKDVLAGVAFVLVLAALAAGFTEVVVFFGLADPREAFLAFAPGGQAEMTVLAIVAGADLGFVVVHHLVRIFFVITCAPLAARLVVRRR
ncbi:AbrB family transcriptional regulator [Thalassococcus sp. BH17M4-6]|uniref:AbrB family transcriptional regulator n=1 Tax=Thalassococcus sp. BH17M4-6 TaxID=3413148 RepID=UPI003BDE3F70